MAELTDYTGYLLRTAFLRAASLVPATFPRGSHPRDAAVLSTLLAAGPVSQQELVARLHVNRSMMVKLIDGLEARGLVERRRNPDDRRSYALYPTAAGRRALMGMIPRMDDGEAMLASALDDAERERLVELLHAIVNPPESAMSGRLGFLLAQAHYRFHGRADAILEPLGIEIRHFGALTMLAEGMPSQRELADRLRVSTPVVVELIDALEARGLVERRRDPIDRRANALAVTDAGRAALESARPQLEAATRDLVAPIGEDGDAELRALLRKLLGL